MLALNYEQAFTFQLSIFVQPIIELMQPHKFCYLESIIVWDEARFCRDSRVTVE